jgi:hypothetical protein
MGVALRTITTTQAEHDGSGASRGFVASDQTPRIPCIGLDAGCIPGTKPGDSAVELERAGRDVVRSRLTRHRFKRV